MLGQVSTFVGEEVDRFLAGMSLLLRDFKWGSDIEFL